MHRPTAPSFRAHPDLPPHTGVVLPIPTHCIEGPSRIGGRGGLSREE